MHKSYDEMRVLFEINVSQREEKMQQKTFSLFFLNCIAQSTKIKFVFSRQPSTKKNYNNQKATKKFQQRKAKRQLHGGRREKMKEMFLSIRNGSQTMHFHSYYAFLFL
jgi:hypothetical protein